MSLDDILIRIEKPVVVGIWTALGALAIAAAAADAANNWLKKHPVEKL